jgi:hypothetical protein
VDIERDYRRTHEAALLAFACVFGRVRRTEEIVTMLTGAAAAAQAVRALLYPRYVTRDERLYQTTDGAGILKGHREWDWSQAEITA